MINTKQDKKRVGYVFTANTVEKLEQLQNLAGPALLEGRSATWLVEYAIHELWRQVLVDVPPTTSNDQS